MEKVKQDMDAKLKEKTNAYNDLEKNMRIKLEYLHNDLEKQKKNFTKEIQDLKDKLGDTQKKFTDAQTENADLKEENETLKTQVEELNKKLEDYSSFKEAIIIILKKIMKNFEPISSNLSCLSCLEFLENPLMLICGHSICLKCFNAHSDPNSKDSIVF
jgi:chromosome segregation ATPase